VFEITMAIGKYRILFANFYARQIVKYQELSR